MEESIGATASDGEAVGSGEGHVCWVYRVESLWCVWLK
jgi:hypothetical protein